MNRATQRTLNEINRRFYDRHAVDFATSRHRPWRGWEGLLEPLQEALPGPLRVLDAGCGNGRFGEFLAARWPAPVHYTGIDASNALLAIARDRLKGKVGLVLACRDLLEEPLGGGAFPRPSSHRSPDPRGGFDLVVAFGVLHHVPGRGQRRRFLESLGAQLAPGGFLACSIWLFGREERFRRRQVPWKALPPELGTLDPEELEEGDYLLRWGDDPRRGPNPERRPSPGEGPGAVRYCHSLSDAEERDWIGGLGLRLVRRYEADGRSRRLNRYLLLQGPVRQVGKT